MIADLFTSGVLIDNFFIYFNQFSGMFVSFLLGWILCKKKYQLLLKKYITIPDTIQTTKLATKTGVLYGLIIMGSVLLNTDKMGLGFLLIFSSLPMNGVITWFFIKKHNDRVKANKSDISSN